MKKIVLIIQARMGSERLPGKSMMDLAGASIIERTIERIKKTRTVDEIVLATTFLHEDNVIADVGESLGISVFRGSKNDLVDRFYQASKAFKADVIVRFPGDNPTPEPLEIDRIVEYHLLGKCDFSSNIMPFYMNGYPMGIGAEVFNLEILEDIWKRNHDPIKREHLALNFFDFFTQKPVEPERYKVGTIQCPHSFRRPDLIFHVDTQEDYQYMRSLYDYLYPKNNNFHITDIIKWHDTIYAKNNKSYEQ